ncbi:GrxA family glutaredoxin [Marinobacter zhejiangensis]|uniref:Glutaredoxin 1 n=1 Tax=Marinobacter zhejiangensis TaxID=488535 RepID=A0A1I4TER9_9GAMM|nr:GrxA family glutaredoxin [Marinobacter zhejiangensis]SFM75103.1 glutaredoxin 1 [Marinobacter zhejiangensis]
MEQVTIFGRMSCGFCVRAKQLCEVKNFPYRFVDMIAEGISKADLEKTVGKPVQTVPQIFVGEQHIGGCDDFFQYVRQAEAAATAG